MKAQELRVGNYIYNGWLSVHNSVTQVTSTEIGYLESFPDHDVYQPVPLTEEWLVKFGFEKLNHKMSNCTVFIKGCWRIATNDFLNYSLWHERISPPTWSLSYLQYVHQLQNLYHALTGEELTCI